MKQECFYKTLGANLKSLRKSKGLTQEQFGTQFGLTKSAIVNYETGIRKIPIDTLIQIAYAYDVSIDTLTAKKRTVADVLRSNIGSKQLNDKQEQLLINYIELLIKE